MSSLTLKPPPLLWWLLWPLVWYTLLSIVCILTTLTVSLMGINKELYYLIIVNDSIDFTWAQRNRSEPEDLIHDFMTLTGIKVGHIRAHGAGDCTQPTFRAYCRRHNIVIKEVPAYTHTFNARAEGAIRICKDKVRAFLRRANMPRRFCAFLRRANMPRWRYFIGVALMPIGPTPAVIPRGKSSTNWGLTPSVMILNVTGMSLAPM